MGPWFELNEADEQAIAAFMSRVAAMPAHATLRDPAQLWWKGQLVRRWDAQRRVQQPLEVIERVEIVAGLAAAAGLLFWVVPTAFRLAAAPFVQLLG
jgi:hypothetical protein